MRSIAGTAAGFMIFMAAPAAAATTLAAANPIYAAADQGNGQNQGGNDQGGNNDAGNNQVRGEGVTTPELPSAALVAVGLVPLLAGAALLRRRGWKGTAR
jgi:hypothetical protein